ncbi:MAG: hypothetical protein ACI8RZ_004764 [Myxococcota bacterium]|jgi:hypothetical protein
MILFLRAAFAAGLHTGIPTTGVEGFAAPMYQTTETGWTALVEDGLVRVFVGRDAESATAWVVTMQKKLEKFEPHPYPEFADEALGDGETILLFRDGNIAVLIHTKANALVWGEVALAAISDEQIPWPAPPILLQDDLGWWRLSAPGAAHIAYVGGERLSAGGLVFSHPPRAGVAWDAWGRAARVEYGSDSPSIPSQ